MATQTPMQPAVPGAVPFAGRKAPVQLPGPSPSFGAEAMGNPGAASDQGPSRSSDPGRELPGREFPGRELVAPTTRRSPAAADGEFRTVSEASMDTGEPFRGLRLSVSLERMPVDVRVAIPVRDFRVRNLLALTSGELIATQWGNGDDLPLLSGEVQLAWSEFEVVDTRLAVRVTRLA